MKITVEERTTLWTGELWIEELELASTCFLFHSSKTSFESMDSEGPSKHSAPPVRQLD